MIGQMKILLRVKTLKEEQALRALQAKRRQVEEGKVARAHAQDDVDASAATLEMREDSIYAEVLGRVVDLDALDDTRAAVVKLEHDHAELTDALDRAAHVLHRLEREAVESAEAHRVASRVKDKYTILTDDLKIKAEAVVAAVEEGEVEELFGSRRQGLA